MLRNGQPWRWRTPGFGFEPTQKGRCWQRTWTRMNLHGSQANATRLDFEPT